MRQIKIETAMALLHDVFWPDFEEIDGSIFLATDQPKKTCDLEHDLDRTGMEAMLNHTHIFYVFKNNAGRQPVEDGDYQFYDPSHPDFLKLCDLGKTLAQMWFQKLQIDFPHYDFRVYYTQEDNPIVLFHRVRPDEPNYLDEERWSEEIKSGKVIIYDTRKMRS